MDAKVETAPAADGLEAPRRYWAWTAIILTVTLAVLDTTIANVALPTISADLGTSPSATIWVVNGYQLAIVVSLLPFASLGKFSATAASSRPASSSSRWRRWPVPLPTASSC